MLWDVCEEHLEEASWRWGQWERALEAPDFTLEDAAEWEELARAHVAGLVAGGAEVEEKLVVPALEEQEVARVSAAALALLERRRQAEDVRWLVRGAAGAPQRAGVQRALEVCEWKGVGEALVPLLKEDDGEVQATALEVLVFRGEAPEAMVTGFLHHEDARLRVAALRGLRGPPASVKGQRLLMQSLGSTHPAIRLAAMEAGLAAGLREAWSACRRETESTEGRARGALVLWAMGCGEEVEPLVAGLRAPEQRAECLWALGFSGQLTAAEACLAWLEDKAVGRLAGEAFSAITGLPLAGKYVLPAEDEDEVSLEEEDLDADLIPRAEDFLPRPNAQAIVTWWREVRERFVRGTRYLQGYPFEGGVLWAALERGPMRRRHAWARELSLRTQGRYRIATRAFTRRQRTELEGARAACTRLSALPLGRMLR